MSEQRRETINCMPSPPYAGMYVLCFFKIFKRCIRGINIAAIKIWDFLKFIDIKSRRLEWNISSLH